MEILLWSYQLGFYLFHFWIWFGRDTNFGVCIIGLPNDRALLHIQYSNTKYNEGTVEHKIEGSILFSKYIKKEF